MASATTTAVINNNLSLVIDFTSTVNTTANTSTVRATMYIRSTSSYATISKGQSESGVISINGVQTKVSANPSVSGNGTKTLGTATVTVPHNADGTKSITVGGWFDLKATISGSYKGRLTTGSRTMVLDRIARASTFGTVTGGTLGSALTVNINRAASHFTHDVYYIKTNGTRVLIGSKVATSTSYTLPLDDVDLLPNSATGTARLELRTFNGSSQMGIVTRNLTVTVPTNIKPTVPVVTIKEANSTIATQFGNYIQTKSKLSVVASASAGRGSSIKQYSTNVSGRTYNGSNITTDTLTASGKVTVRVVAIDARGRSNFRETVIDVLPYVPPKITTFKAERSVTKVDTLEATVNASISPYGDKNTKSFAIRYKADGTNTWKTVDVTNQTSTYTLNKTIDISGVSGDNTYTVELVVKDFFETVSSDRPLQTDFTLMNFHPNGKAMAFGQVMSRDSGLDIRFQTRIMGGLDLITEEPETNKPIANSFLNMIFPKGRHAYITFMEEERRKGWIGYGHDGTDNISIANNIGGNIVLNTGASGASSQVIIHDGQDLRTRFYQDSDEFNIETSSSYIKFNKYIKTGNTAELDSSGNHVVLRTRHSDGIIYMQAGNEVRAVKPLTVSSYIPVRASSFPTSSSMEYKTNGKELSEKKAKRILDSLKPKEYHLKTNLESGIFDKPKMGFYTEMSPPEIRDEDGVDVYSIATVLATNVKRQDREIKELKKEISDLYTLLGAVCETHHTKKESE